MLCFLLYIDAYHCLLYSVAVPPHSAYTIILDVDFVHLLTTIQLLNVKLLILFLLITITIFELQPHQVRKGTRLTFRLFKFFFNIFNMYNYQEKTDYKIVFSPNSSAFSQYVQANKSKSITSLNITIIFPDSNHETTSIDNTNELGKLLFR